MAVRMKSIARIDQEQKYKTTKGKWSTRSTKGWYVQVAWKGKKYTRFFADGKYGGPNKSKKAAVDWRDETEAKIGKPQTARPVIFRAPNTNKNVGVCLTTKDGADVYQVSWVDNKGNHGRTTVSIRQWGKAEAKRRALALRNEKHFTASGASAR